MSIWCSWPHIGSDRGDAAPERGNVLTYAEGFSNHYPDLTGTHERPAAVALAHIPQWCVPGHEETGDYAICGPWLRLEVAGWQALNFWAKDALGKPLTEDVGATVVLDEEAVRSLRDDLTAWLDRPKARPMEDA